MKKKTAQGRKDAKRKSRKMKDLAVTGVKKGGSVKGGYYAMKAGYDLKTSKAF